MEPQQQQLQLQPLNSLPTSSPITPKPTTKDTSPPIITIPSCSRWFTWDKVHESERRFLPEFFDEKSPSKNTRVYMYYRNSIIKMFRENPTKKITFTQVRKVLVGDVGAIRRVFDFLDGWGLINYAGMSMTPVKALSKWDEKENREFKGTGTSTRFCSGCQTVCVIACFVSNKLDETLCSRCYVHANARVGFASHEFRRVNISEQTKTEWTKKETLQLFEAIMHYGDDWKKVAEHVGGRSEKECVARFIKVPFREQFIDPPNSEVADNYCGTIAPHDDETGEEISFPTSPVKKRRLTPFADTSNPIMAQVAFLSAMVGSGVAEAAARAAVHALSDSNLSTDPRCMERSYMSLPDDKDSALASNESDTMNTIVEAITEAQAHIQKEEQDLEKSIIGIVEVQMKKLEDKIVHFEEVELLMEKEWKQLQYLKNLLFTDQLRLLFQTTTPQEVAESISGAKTLDSVK